MTCIDNIIIFKMNREYSWASKAFIRHDKDRIDSHNFQLKRHLEFLKTTIIFHEHSDGCHGVYYIFIFSL